MAPRLVIMISPFYQLVGDLCIDVIISTKVYLGSIVAVLANIYKYIAQVTPKSDYFYDKEKNWVKVSQKYFVSL